MLSQGVVFTTGNACSRMRFVTMGNFAYTLKDHLSSVRTELRGAQTPDSRGEEN